MKSKRISLPSKLRLRLKNLVREKLIRRFLLPPEISNGWNLNDREGALNRAWGFVFNNQITGGYYELGVYRGDSFRAAYASYGSFYRWQQGQLNSSEPWRRKVAVEYAAHRHHFYAFDTFEGMPANEESPAFEEGNYISSLEEFTQLNREAGIEENAEIRYFKGTFAETKERRGDDLNLLQPAAIVNLDSDLYSSTEAALKIVADKFIQGTILLVDDYNNFSAKRNLGP